LLIKNSSFYNISHIVHTLPIAHEMEENNKIIEKLESDLACTKGCRDILIEGSKKSFTAPKKRSTFSSSKTRLYCCGYKGLYFY